MKPNYYRRILFELQLVDLAKEAGDSLGDTWHKVSNRELLVMINIYLKKFNCLQFSPQEITRISRLMNN